ncbi:VOC family protein [Paenibacillus sp. S-38]|uniref:VOC family protein n=1 Tax=Paenibacillus sp. S-38 TaxID=3416710 RepID=UPI003CF1E720
MIKGIGHLAFDVSDMEQSLHFYCNVLGLTKAFEIHNDENQPWIVYLQVSGLQFIELFYGGRNRPEHVERPIGFSHLCLEVESVEAMAAHLRNRSVPLDVEPQMGKDLNWQCWVRDPDGNRIEFMQLDPQSPQARCGRGEPV